ncbi:MAG: cell division protein ZapA [Rhodanobacteraceae bacterium]
MGDPVSIHILDREFLIACTPEERAGLLDAAAMLDAKMREVRANARGAALDRIAVLTALNLAHELLTLQREGNAVSSSLDRGLKALQLRLDGAFD